MPRKLPPQLQAHVDRWTAAATLDPHALDEVERMARRAIDEPDRFMMLTPATAVALVEAAQVLRMRDRALSAIAEAYRCYVEDDDPAGEVLARIGSVIEVLSL